MPQAAADILLDKLIWLDMEMTGLSHVENVIIEVAVVVTDNELNIIDQTPSYAIFQPDSELSKMDRWNRSTHSKSGLIERVKASQHSLEEIENEILQLIKKYTKKGESPLCGNTIHQDRKFIAKYMPALENFLHYRNIDVSTIKELARRWYPDIFSAFKKQNKHQALDDIIESINELKYYRDKMFIPKVSLNNDLEITTIP